jgi:hypothetical protein
MSVDPAQPADAASAGAQSVSQTSSVRRRATTLTRNWMSTVSHALAKAKDEAIEAEAQKQKVIILFAQASELSLAAFLRANGELERALHIYEECLFKRVNVLGEDHPDTIIIAHAVAYTMYLQGNAQALPLLQESLAKWRAVKGDDHPNTILYQARRDACAAQMQAP